MSHNAVVVTCEEQVEHTPFYRTTITGAAVTTDVFIELTAQWQVHHEHLFDSLDASGSACCYQCGATAWCEAWVAADYLGDFTHAWAGELWRAFFEREKADLPEIETMRQQRAVLVVALDPSEPA